MELRDYIKIYWKQRALISLIVLVSTVTAVAVAATRPERTAVSVSFAINRTNREETTQYQYDGYYALQAADLFAQTVVSWFSTPSVILDVYQQAHLDPAIKSIQSLPSRFSVRKYSAQNIVVKFTESDKDRATTLASGLTTVMESKASKLNQTRDGKSFFEIVAGPPVIAPAQSNLPLIASVTFILSLALGLFVAAARQYLR